MKQGDKIWISNSDGGHPQGWATYTNRGKLHGCWGHCGMLYTNQGMAAILQDRSDYPTRQNGDGETVPRTYQNYYHMAEQLIATGEIKL